MSHGQRPSRRMHGQQMGGPPMGGQGSMGGPGYPQQMGGPGFQPMGGMGGPGYNQIGGPGYPQEMGGPGYNQMGGPGYPQQMGGPGYNQMGGPGYPQQMGGPGYNQMGGGPGYPQQMPGPMYNQQMGGPVMQQPMPGMMGAQMMWCPAPTEIPPGCPPGLEYLSLVNHLFVKQFVEPFEVMTGYETANRYQILNNFGQRIYLAMEESDACLRQCRRNNRPFTIHVLDVMNREVIRVNRPCQCCTMQCCNQKRVMVEAPVGVPIGVVEEECDCCFDAFAIRQISGQRILSIRKCCCLCNCGYVEFDVYDNARAKVGEVKKLWSGAIQEQYTDADNFGITFPNTLDVRAKALIIGACFLLDFVFFED